MKPPPGQRRVTFNISEPLWAAMKQAMRAVDVPHAAWLRAAVRQAIRRQQEADDEY